MLNLLKSINVLLLILMLLTKEHHILYVLSVSCYSWPLLPCWPNRLPSFFCKYCICFFFVSQLTFSIWQFRLLIKRVWLVQLAIIGPIWHMSLLSPPLDLLVNQSICSWGWMPSVGTINYVQGGVWCHTGTYLHLTIFSFSWNSGRNAHKGTIITNVLICG